MTPVQQQPLPCGQWPSPLSAQALFASTQTISCVRRCRNGVFFLLSMPEEGNALALMHLSPKGQSTRVSPLEVNVRSMVHEYGGMAYTFSDESVFYCNFSDQRIYRQTFDQITLQSGPRRAMTPLIAEASRVLRFADLVIDQPRQRLLCVREDHRNSDSEPRNTLIAIPFDSENEGEVLFDSSDFVSSPALSPVGDQLAFQTWSHPNMPWDETQIQVAEVAADGSLKRIRQLCKERPGALVQPAFGPTGDLFFLADWSDWWNLYRIDSSTLAAGEVKDAECMLNVAAELCGPQWQSGQRNYAFADADTVLVSLVHDCFHDLALLDLQARKLPNRKVRPLSSGLGQLENLNCHDHEAVFFAATTQEAGAIYQIDLAVAEPKAKVLFRGRSGIALPAETISAPEHFSYGGKNGARAHGLFYPPCNPLCQPLPGTRPPLLVSIHGGPTGTAKSAFNPMIQFWTSRGFAWLDVNHRGSAGYGRRFRQSLNGQWGVIDIEDTINAVQHLLAIGKVDADRIAIRGGSAGGFAVLSALSQSNVFCAGVSYYGISDLEMLARDTHKFESRYLDQLIGPYPEQAELYRQRSPLHHIDKITAPVLLLQGRLDKVVPPNQAESITHLLQKNNPLTRCVYFEDEGHGFRKPPNQIAALEAELAFYEKVLL